MADTSVETEVSTVFAQVNIGGPYYVGDNGIIVYSDGGEDLTFTRTTDGGVTWAETQVELNAIRALAVYFDQETPGDIGTLVHVAWGDRGGLQDFKYVTIDVNDGSVGTIRIVDAGVTLSNSTNLNRVAIAKARNGLLMVAFSTQTEIECYTSADAGETWDARSDVFETTTEEDYVLLFPGNVDAGDFAAFFWDRSASEISVKMFDESENTWTETAILSSMTANATRINIDGATRHSDGLILGCAHSAEATAGDDLRTFTVNPNSISSPSIDTTTANVFTDQAESAQCAIHINQPNDDVRIAYLKGGTWLATVDCVYHLSSDGMENWDAESEYTEDIADDLRLVSAGRTGGSDGGHFQPVVYNNDLTELFINLNLDVALVVAQAGAGGPHSWRGALLGMQPFRGPFLWVG